MLNLVTTITSIEAYAPISYLYYCLILIFVNIGRLKLHLSTAGIKKCTPLHPDRLCTYSTQLRLPPRFLKSGYGTVVKGQSDYVLVVIHITMLIAQSEMWLLLNKL